MRKGDPKSAAKKARYFREYETLKRELDYESPTVDMSDSSEDEMSDSNAGKVGNNIVV